MIDNYLTPAVLGEDVFLIERLLARMDKVAARNQFAKAAVEMAAHDAIGRLLGVPLSHLLGGAVRPAVAVLWPLGIGRLDEDVAEAREKIEAGQHRVFKIKMGAAAPEDDVRRVLATAREIGAPCRVDLNQAWDEPTAARWVPHLEAGGIELVEAPIPGWNRDGMRRLAERLIVPIMADEEVWDMHDHWNAAVGAATDVVAVKVAKSGGVWRARKIAALAEAAGLPTYGGMALESSIGTAASAQLFSTIPNLDWGCESVGPLLLADDPVVRPVEYRDGTLIVPDAPGLGVELDRSKLAHYKRDA
ncbi:MAG: muconate/chloromuconate family cycloisomerase, partial [Acetobacteraceae bacterium]